MRILQFRALEKAKNTRHLLNRFNQGAGDDGERAPRGQFSEANMGQPCPAFLYCYFTCRTVEPCNRLFWTPHRSGQWGDGRWGDDLPKVVAGDVTMSSRRLQGWRTWVSEWVEEGTSIPVSSSSRLITTSPYPRLSPPSHASVFPQVFPHGRGGGCPN